MTDKTEQSPSLQDDTRTVLQETLFAHVQTMLSACQTESFALQIPETGTLILVGPRARIVEVLGQSQAAQPTVTAPLKLYAFTEDGMEIDNAFGHWYKKDDVERLLAGQSQATMQAEWTPLNDVQWMNIVNHDHAYHSFTKDEAVHEAVKRTEAKLKELNADPGAKEAAPAGQQQITRLDLLSLIHSQCHRVYASAIDREEIDTKYMAEIEDALRAVYADASAAPEGWKLVPLKLTPEMRSAWDKAPQYEDDSVEFAEAYRAMLAAAPQAPATQEAEIGSVQQVSADPELSLYVAYGDDDAVDLFAKAMKAKMAASRAKGRGGWHDPDDCPAERLQVMLIDHLAKGDPVDVGNFAMMLWNRGERVIAPTTSTVSAPTNEDFVTVWELHGGHPADFAADVLERWGGWPAGVLGQGGRAQAAPEEVRNQALSECIKIAESELFNMSALMSMPPQSAAAWNIANRIRALKTPGGAA